MHEDLELANEVVLLSAPPNKPGQKTSQLKDIPPPKLQMEAAKMTAPNTLLVTSGTVKALGANPSHFPYHTEPRSFLSIRPLQCGSS